MKQHNDENFKLIQKILTDDQFDDSVQNEKYEGVSGEKILLSDFREYSNHGLTLDIGCGNGELFGKLPITHAIEPNNKREGLALKRKVDLKKNIYISPGWAEALTYSPKTFKNVICWGTACFFRSPIEAYMEINRVLMVGGKFFFDVVGRTTMPIAQTVDIASFADHIKLFGFDVLKQQIFGPDHHLRLALVVMKARNFDPKYFRMPQCVGKINNYVEDRDWYLK